LETIYKGTHLVDSSDVYTIEVDDEISLINTLSLLNTLYNPTNPDHDWLWIAQQPEGVWNALEWSSVW